MSECYYIAMENGKLIFTFNDIGVPDCVEKGCLAKADEALDMVCRMGDPDILECLVYRHQNSPGGIFTLRDKNGPLFCAVAKSNLIYAVALGYFGERVANARYGIDVFENLEEPDD